MEAQTNILGMLGYVLTARQTMVVADSVFYTSNQSRITQMRYVKPGDQMYIGNLFQQSKIGIIYPTGDTARNRVFLQQAVCGGKLAPAEITAQLYNLEVN